MFGARRAADNYKKVEKMLHLVGIDKERVRLEMVSAAESPKFAKIITEMINQVKGLGPSPLRKTVPTKTFEIEITDEEPALAAG